MMKCIFKMLVVVLVLGVGVVFLVFVVLVQLVFVVCFGYEKGKIMFVGECIGKKVQKVFEFYNED